MRLLILTSEFPPGPGGIGTHAYNLACQLDRMGWEVTVIGRQDYTSREEATRFNQSLPFEMIRLQPHRFSALDAAYRWGKTLFHSRTLKADILVATGSRSLWVAAALPRRVPLVVIGHGTELGVSGFGARLTRYAFERADHVVCVSEFTREYMIRKGIMPKSVSVIHNGANHEVFRRLPEQQIAEFRRKKGFNAHRLLLTVGHVSERKGQDTVIRALPSVLERVPDVHYLVAGLPTRREDYRRLARQLGVEKHVHFLGKVSREELVQLYSACDIFVLTSRLTEDGDFEGYGIVVTEAALCGAPAVVSNGSGLTEAVKDGVTGLVVAQENPEDTAQAIVQLLQDTSLRHTLAAQARSIAETEQTWARRAEEYHALFSSLARP